MIIVYSIFLFDDFSNSVLRDFRYIYYLNPPILKNILNDNVVITFILLPDFLIREILENSIRETRVRILRYFIIRSSMLKLRLKESKNDDNKLIFFIYCLPLRAFICSK